MWVFVPVRCKDRYEPRHQILHSVQNDRLLPL